MAGTDGGLSPYVPRLVAEWDLDAPDAKWRELDATCCFVDISGFTALSERLARRGRIGAEELTEVLNHVFSRMLGIAYDKGGALLKFGGDALLLSFTDSDHAILAAQAAVAMRSALREARTLPTSVGRVNLKMSVGLHSGMFHVFRVGDVHRELLITGPAASTTTRMEQIAEAGEIVISEATAARLPANAVGNEKGDGRLLRWRRVEGGGPGPTLMRELKTEATETAIPIALRGRLSQRGGEAEHRKASVAFLKFQGVDDLLAAKGPDETADALDIFVRAVQSAAKDEAVTFLASDIDANGGKIILTTGVPIAQDDDEGRVLRAARVIIDQALPLSVRIGVNSGHVFAGAIGTEFRRTFTIMGDTVNLAARLMAAASPGDVLATALVLENARTQFKVDALEPFMVKGKSEPVQAYQVGPPVGPKQDTSGTLPFRGRDKELGLLLAAFRRAEEGRGSVAVVEAERGAGKTRLVNEFLASAAPETILLFQGEPYGTAIAYFSLRTPLRRLLNVQATDRREAGRELEMSIRSLKSELLPFVPFIAPIVDADVDPTPQSEAVAEKFIRDRVADVLAETLDVACSTPLVLVAEDAHWFDDASSEICSRLADATRFKQWMLLASRRFGQEGFDPPQAEPRVSLSPLAEEAARELVEAATDAAPLRPQERDGIISRAGGSPLFLDELLRIARSAGTGSLPDSLDAVAMREIDLLPPTPRRVLLYASVLGRSFDPDLLTQLLRDELVYTDTDPLELLSTQLLVEGDGRMCFRHAVLQEAAYQSLPFRTRLGLHRQVGETIERSDWEMLTAAPWLSFHFLAAHEWERAWRYARTAAQAATAANAPGEAATHLERAITAAHHFGRLDEEELANVLTDLGSTLEVLGEYERADHAYRRAGLMSKRNALRRAAVAERRAYIRSEYQGRPSAAIRQLRAGRSELEMIEMRDAEFDRMLAKLLAREADVRMRQGRLSQAIARAGAAVEEAERVGDKRSLALALYVLDISLLQSGRLTEATHMGRVLELFEELDDQLGVANTLNNLGGVAFFVSDWSGAADYMTRAAGASVLAGDLAGAAIAQMNIGEIRVNQGRLDEAVALLVPARRNLESFGFRVMAGLATMQLGRARAFLGDLDIGVEMERLAVTTFDEIGSVVECLEARARLAEVLVFARQFEEAQIVLTQARDLENAAEVTPLSSLLDRVALTLAERSDDSATFRAQLDRFVDRARKLGATYDLVVMLALAGRLGAGEGDEEAVRLSKDLGVVKLAMLAET